MSVLIDNAVLGAGFSGRTLGNRLGDYVSAKDYGATGNGTTDDTAALQAALTEGSTNSRRVYIPKGTYKITDSLWATALGSTYQGCHIVGEAQKFAAAAGAGTIINCATLLDKPALILHHHRTAYVADLMIEGPNVNPSLVNSGKFRFGGVTGTAQGGAAGYIDLAAADRAADNLYQLWVVTITSGTGSGQQRICSTFVRSTKRLSVSVSWTTPPDATSVYHLTPWVTAGLRDSRYSPQCAIGINVGRGADPSDGGYPGLVYVNSSGGSGSTIIERVTLRSHVVGILIGPDTPNNDDRIALNDLEIAGAKVGVAVCHAQARAVSLNRGQIYLCRSVYSSDFYGNQQGDAVAMNGCLVVGCYELANHQPGFGPAHFTDVEAESTHRLGYFASGAANQPISFRGLRWKGMSYSTYAASGPPAICEINRNIISFDDCYLKQDGTTRNAYQFTTSVSGVVVHRGTKFGVEDTRRPLIAQINNCLPSVELLNCRVEGINGSNDHYLGRTGRIGSDIPSVRVELCGELFLATRSTIYKVTPGSSSGPVVSLAFSGWSKGNSQATFTATDVTLLQVGDELGCACTLPRGEVAGESTYQGIFALKIASIVGSVVTCDYVGDCDYIAESQSTLFQYRGEWAPIGTLTGNTTASNADLTSVVGVAGLRVGDWIKGTGIATNARITAIVSTTVTMNKVATGTGTAAAISYATLTAL